MALCTYFSEEEKQCSKNAKPADENKRPIYPLNENIFS